MSVTKAISVTLLVTAMLSPDIVNAMCRVVDPKTKFYLYQVEILSCKTDEEFPDLMVEVKLIISNGLATKKSR